MRFCLIACEVLYREVCLCTAQSRNIIDIEFVGQGLHDVGTEKMRDYLQGIIDKAGSLEKYDAILLGYGLCNNGLVGLSSEKIRMVVPRAHDCITLFLGSKERYRNYFDSNPGTYFKTTGWMERDHVTLDVDIPMTGTQPGVPTDYEGYVKQYGEENARYIMETLSGLKNYKRITYIEMGVAGESDYIEEARGDAAKESLDFERVSGDMGMIRNLLEGNWRDEEFMVVNPGEEIMASNDDMILKVVALTEGREVGKHG